MPASPEEPRAPCHPAEVDRLLRPVRARRPECARDGAHGREPVRGVAQPDGRPGRRQGSRARRRRPNGRHHQAAQHAVRDALRPGGHLRPREPGSTTSSTTWSTPATCSASTESSRRARPSIEQCRDPHGARARRWPPRSPRSRSLAERRAALVELKRFEDEADLVVRDAIASLFHSTGSTRCS